MSNSIGTLADPIMPEQATPVHAQQPENLPKTERRAWIRFRNEQPCNAEDANTAWLGKIRDVSAGGIALTLKRRFEPGASLIIEVETKSGWPRRLSVQVIHATQDENGRWTIGCDFASPLSQEELQTILA